MAMAAIVRSLTKRKDVRSALARTDREALARKLGVIDLTVLGVGATIGAGFYTLVGAVVVHAGPAVIISIFIAGVVAALSAFCYAELACRCPSAGSSYHYSYICIGEGAAWFVGWALILEYTIGGSAIARSLTPNMALYFGGEDNLPFVLARHTIPGFGIVVDPCAAVLILVITLLLCIGIKESSTAQSIVTTVNVCVMLFITVAGGYLGFKNGWAGYELPNGYFPSGVNGVLSGAAIAFFSYIGFDSVTSTAEEVENPQRDLPLGIAFALSICCMLYMLVSGVIVGLVPYYNLDPQTPISSAFSELGMKWAVYIITTGAVTALFASLLGSILPQPRIFMTMARDGLLPPFFSEINSRTQVPVNRTIVMGVLAAILAFLIDFSGLIGMANVGTLLAFTAVAISVLIIRYVPPKTADPMPHVADASASAEGKHHQPDNDANASDEGEHHQPDNEIKAADPAFDEGEHHQPDNEIEAADPVVFVLDAGCEDSQPHDLAADPVVLVPNAGCEDNQPQDEADNPVPYVLDADVSDKDNHLQSNNEIEVADPILPFPDAGVYHGGRCHNYMMRQMTC